ncbi:hypothetical protein HRbin33_02218 [bacterium HR33]|nr:hypothetical protein HRbin33_02218 [bacterium HR33]
MSLSKAVSFTANLVVVAVGMYVIARPNGLAHDVWVWLRGGKDRVAVSSVWDRLMAASSVAHVGTAGGSFFVEFVDYECVYCVVQQRMWMQVLGKHADIELRYIQSATGGTPACRGGRAGCTVR